jgi:hypothetical protein
MGKSAYWVVLVAVEVDALSGTRTGVIISASCEKSLRAYPERFDGTALHRVRGARISRHGDIRVANDLKWCSIIVQKVIVTITP